MKLDILPSADESRKRHGSAWPAGWWITSMTYSCCGTERGHRIRHGQRIYLTGKSGEMYCSKHAPAEVPAA